MKFARLFIFLLLSTATITACGGSSNSAPASSLPIASSIYNIGGTLTGLNGTVVLQNNGGDDLTIATDGSFSFATGMNDASAYSISIPSSPLGQSCIIANNIGTVSGADINNIAVSCGDSGALDLSFNTSGKATIDVGGINADDETYAIASQTDGKIIVAGSYYNGTEFDSVIARYRQDGTLDPSFNTTGLVTLDVSGAHFYDGFNAIVIQTDGKIVVGGQEQNGDPDSVIARFNSDGSLDSTFGTNGIVITDISGLTKSDFVAALTLQSDGKIIAVGRSFNSGTTLDSTIERFNSDGSLDSTFGTGGIVFTDISGVNVNDQADGVAYLASDQRIVTVGSVQNGGYSHAAVTMFTSTGSLDTTFNSTGIVIQDVEDAASGSAVAFQADGKIVITGSAHDQANFSNDTFLARYMPTGALDPTFNTNGVVTTSSSLGTSIDDEAKSMVIQPDNKIIICGRIYANNGNDNDFFLARYTEMGVFDPNFNHGVPVTTDILNSSTDQARSVSLQPNGKIIVTGRTY